MDVPIEYLFGAQGMFGPLQVDHPIVNSVLTFCLGHNKHCCYSDLSPSFSNRAIPIRHNRRTLISPPG
jgi:hypothetical protein